jgi:hypothetical protein
MSTPRHRLPSIQSKPSQAQIITILEVFGRERDYGKSSPWIQPEFWSGVDCVDCIQTLSMFGKFLVHAWSQCGGLNEELCILVHWGAKFVVATQPFPIQNQSN